MKLDTFFSKTQPIKSFDYFIQNSVANWGQKIVHGQVQVNMKRYMTGLAFSVSIVFITSPSLWTMTKPCITRL